MMLEKILRQFRSVSSGRGEEASDCSKETNFLLLLEKLPVLVLTRSSAGWRMFYTDEFKAQAKVKPLVPFPDVDKVYQSPELWPFFAVRIPSIARPEIQRTIREEALNYDDVAAMLIRFGRKSIADPFELKTKEEVELSIAGS